MAKSREEAARDKALLAIQKAELRAVDENTTAAQFDRFNQLAKNAVAAYAEVIGVDPIVAALRLRSE